MGYIVRTAAETRPEALLADMQYLAQFGCVMAIRPAHGLRNEHGQSGAADCL